MQVQIIDVCCFHSDVSERTACMAASSLISALCQASSVVCLQVSSSCTAIPVGSHSHRRTRRYVDDDGHTAPGLGDSMTKCQAYMYLSLVYVGLHVSLISVCRPTCISH